MKIKVLLIILVFAMVLSSCGYQPAYTPSATPTPLPAGQGNQHIVTALPAVDTTDNQEIQSPALPDTLNKDYLIASQDDVDVYFFGADKSGNNDESYEILIHNKSDITLYASSNNIAINSRSLLPYIATVVEANSYYIYYDTYPSEYGSFLEGYDQAVSVQVEMNLFNYDDKTLYSYIDAELVVDDSVEILPHNYEGHIIYNEDDFVIGIDKIVDENNITGLMLYYENNTDTSLIVLIENILVDSYDLSHQSPVSITHQSYAYWPIELEEAIPNKTYDVTLDYALVTFLDACVTDEFEGESLTFTLK